MQLSVIMPAYLEEENLRILLPRVKKVLKEVAPKSEIIVVDTERPMDGTPVACEEFDVTYINRTGSNTYGSAIRSGINAARGEFIIFMDADGSHYPDFIKELWAYKDSHDITIASRYIEGGHTENSSTLILMSKIVNWGFSFVLGIKAKDVSNSFKLYKGSHLKELNLKCDNFDIVEEIIYKIIRKHPQCEIKEVPFSFKQRMFGETKRNLPLFILTYFQTLIKLRFFT
ncbi:MAG: glycosyltransferase [Bdellovibrionota bacterium]|nr:glycosyltransferase [Bdellovibrionota bacterium]